MQQVSAEELDGDEFSRGAEFHMDDASIIVDQHAQPIADIGIGINVHGHQPMGKTELLSRNSAIA